MKFAAGVGAAYLLKIVGIISASLAIFNLLPMPVLDGGSLEVSGGGCEVRYEGSTNNIAIAFTTQTHPALMYGRWNGTAWSPQQSPRSLTLTSVFGTSASQVFAVGPTGTFLQHLTP